jgi:hypothetical protein
MNNINQKYEIEIDEKQEEQGIQEEIILNPNEREDLKLKHVELKLDQEIQPVLDLKLEPEPEPESETETKPDI